MRPRRWDTALALKPCEEVIELVAGYPAVPPDLDGGQHATRDPAFRGSDADAQDRGNLGNGKETFLDHANTPNLRRGERSRLGREAEQFPVSITPE